MSIQCSQVALGGTNFFFFRNLAKDGFEGRTAAVAMVWGGLLHTFPCNRAESSEGVHLIFWDRSFANWPGPHPSENVTLEKKVNVRESWAVSGHLKSLIQSSVGLLSTSPSLDLDSRFCKEMWVILKYTGGSWILIHSTTLSISTEKRCKWSLKGRCTLSDALPKYASRSKESREQMGNRAKLVLAS